MEQLPKAAGERDQAQRLHSHADQGPTDDGITGWGSAFTNDALVRAALKVLEPLYIGENPLEPERVSERLRAHSFWLGRGGTITHTISEIDTKLNRGPTPRYSLQHGASSC